MEPKQVWGAIDKNLHGLLTFFDALLTRDRLPVIQYEETFASPERPLNDLLGPIGVPVEIAPALYADAKRNLVEKLNQRLDRFPKQLAHDVNQELGAFAYDWHPKLPGLQATTVEQRKVAEFLVGGMVFGSYAQATGTDHLVQANRSTLLLKVSAPQPELSMWRSGQERILFDQFKKHCNDPASNVRATDFAAPPSVLPYLLLQKPAPTQPMDLLTRCLSLRKNRLGQDYRTWYANMRQAWSLGRDDPTAEESVRIVLRSLRHRMLRQDDKDDKKDRTGSLTASIGFKGPLPAGAIEGVPLKMPQWLRTWMVDHFPMRPHRRLLLRMSLAQARYRDVTLHLQQLWRDS